MAELAADEAGGLVLERAVEGGQLAQLQALVLVQVVVVNLQQPLDLFFGSVNLSTKQKSTNRM